MEFLKKAVVLTSGKGQQHNMKLLKKAVVLTSGKGQFTEKIKSESKAAFIDFFTSMISRYR